MNSVREIQRLNKRELENGVAPSASWHADYRDTAYIFIGGLPYNLTEGDIITIFSQYGEPVACHLQRDKDTGKSKGFCFLKYEDQRSTELAVDNLGGTTILGRIIRVDHHRYKPKDGDDLGISEAGGYLEEVRINMRTDTARKEEDEIEDERPLLREEVELAKLIREHDDEDPMKEFLVSEKKEEVRLALERAKLNSGTKKERKHRHRHRHREHDEKGRELERHQDREGHDQKIKNERDTSWERNAKHDRVTSRRKEGTESKYRLRGSEDVDDRDRDDYDDHHRRHRHRDSS